MKRNLWIVGILVLIALGFVFVKGTSPEVRLPSETIFTIGPLQVRNTLFTSWFVIAFLAIMSYLSTRQTSLVPVRFLQNFVEAVIEWMLGIVEGVAGETNGRRFFPIVATIFLYVITSNWFGLLPIYNTIGTAKPPEVLAGETGHATVYSLTHISGLTIALQPLFPKSVDLQANQSGQVTTADGKPLSSVTNNNPNQAVGALVPFFRSTFSDANAPLSIAFVSFFMVEYWGLSTLGVGTYLSKFFNFGPLLHGNPMGIIDIFVGLIELISELIRIISFTARLLGNIFAGEVLLGFMTFILPFVIPSAFYGLELFFGLIQASIFALLTLVFAVVAVEHHSADEQHAHPSEINLEPV